MRNLYITIFALLIINVLNAQSNNWSSFFSEELGFKIDFPEKPTNIQDETVSTEHGTIDRQTVSVEIENGNNKAIYLITRSEYPKLIAHDLVSNIDAFYQERTEAIANEMTGRISTYRTVHLNDNTRGKNINIMLNNRTLTLDMRIFLVDNILYEIKTIHPVSMDQKIKDEFLDSFELTTIAN